MPYKREGNIVYVKKNGEWKEKGKSKDAATAEKYMKVLYAAEKGQLNEGFDEDTIDPNQPELAISVELSSPTQTMANFLSTFMASRTQAHIFHLQITGPGSFTAHTALQAYYEGIVPLIDALAESFQGRYGIITGYKCEGQWIENTSSLLKYFEALCMYVEKNRQSLPQDSYIQNQVDTFVELIESTKYKLSKLM
jgi:hypothetical protein